MNNEVKSKLSQLVDFIKDENILQNVIEDLANYASNKDIPHDLNKEKLKELDEAISEADKNESMNWKDFKKEMIEWKIG